MEEKLPKFNFFSMFWEGFRNMTLGKTLWALVIIKLIIMFLILKPVFFPDFLNSKFHDENKKADHVKQQLIERSTE